jgi:hypothetical protein
LGSFEIKLTHCNATIASSFINDRIAIVGNAWSGKTYAAKGFIERLLDSGARVARRVSNAA